MTSSMCVIYTDGFLHPTGAGFDACVNVAIVITMQLVYRYRKLFFEEAFRLFFSIIAFVK